MEKYNVFEELNKLDEELLNEMASIGCFGKTHNKKQKFKYEVYIRSKDSGFVPHMHIWDANSNGDDFDSAIKLESPEYFPYGGKYEDKFNSGDLDALISFLKGQDEEEPDKTRWQVVIIEWNRNNSSRKLPLDQPMPDYSKLK